MERRKIRISEILRIITHADQFGIPDIVIDMVYSMLINV